MDAHFPDVRVATVKQVGLRGGGLRVKVTKGVPLMRCARPVRRSKSCTAQVLREAMSLRHAVSTPSKGSTKETKAWTPST